MVTTGSPDALALATVIQLDIEGGRATGEAELTAGDEVGVILQWSRSWEERPAPWDAADVRARLDDTLAAWASWSGSHQAYAGPYRDLVCFSGAVLHGLTFQPTGAIVAAATTSLPESVGGDRNWDYRYGWLRDASMTLDALWVAACPDEAAAFVSWLAVRQRPTCGTTHRSRSCTASPASTTSRSVSCPTSRDGAEVGPYAWATPRSISDSSTCTARSSTPSSDSGTCCSRSTT